MVRRLFCIGLQVRCRMMCKCNGCCDRQRVAALPDSNYKPVSAAGGLLPRLQQVGELVVGNVEVAWAGHRSAWVLVVSSDAFYGDNPGEFEGMEGKMGFCVWRMEARRCLWMLPEPVRRHWGFFTISDHVFRDEVLCGGQTDSVLTGWWDCFRNLKIILV